MCYHIGMWVELRRRSSLTKAGLSSLSILLVLLVGFSLFIGCRSEAPIFSSSSSTSSATTEETAAVETVEESPAWEPYMEEGDHYFAEGEYYKAARAYKKVLRMDPDNLEAKEKLRVAQDILEEARIHYDNGMQFWYEQKYDDALAELKRAVEIYPKFKEAQDNLEVLMNIMGIAPESSTQS